MSIGKQVSRGRTFIWRHGEKPYPVTDHRKCTAWCPLEHRWYAKRVQNNVPIFALEPQQDMTSKALEAEPDGEAQEAAVGLAPSRDQLGSLVNRDLDGHEHAGVCALHQDGHGGVDNHTSFCGGRMERLYACACHLEDISVAAPSKVTHVHTEHLHKQRRKEKSRKKWQSHKKASGRESSNCDHCGDSSVFRGKDAADSMMTELQTFYGEHAKLHDPETAKVYESLASSISREAGLQTCPSRRRCARAPPCWLDRTWNADRVLHLPRLHDGQGRQGGQMHRDPHECRT